MKKQTEINKQKAGALCCEWYIRLTIYTVERIHLTAKDADVAFTGAATKMKRILQ